MTLWQRIKNLWKLSALDLSEVQERVDAAKSKYKPAHIIEPTFNPERIEPL